MLHVPLSTRLLARLRERATFDRPDHSTLFPGEEVEMGTDEFGRSKSLESKLSLKAEERKTERSTELGESTDFLQIAFLVLTTGMS